MPLGEIIHVLKFLQRGFWWSAWRSDQGRSFGVCEEGKQKNEVLNEIGPRPQRGIVPVSRTTESTPHLF